MGYQLVQAGYWLALSLWFGGAVFVALAARAIFAVLAEEKPVLAHVLAVNLEDQHGTLLGSAIVSRLLAVVGRVQLAAAGVVIALAGVQFAVADVRGSNGTAAIVRVALAVAAAGVLAFDRFVVFPRLSKHRQTYIENADEPEVANPAKEAFDRDQQLTLTLILTSVCLLAGLVLFSAPITPATQVTVLSGGK